MNMAVQSIEPRGDYRAIKERLWGKPRVVNVHVEEQRRIEEYRREQREKLEREQAAKKPAAPKRPRTALLWLREFNAHVIAYRQWQLAVETNAAYPPESKVPVEEIVYAVLDDFPDVSMEEIRGERRERCIVRPRQIAMYETYRRRPDLSMIQIGRWFGNRDHTTVLHAIRKMAEEFGPAR